MGQTLIYLRSVTFHLLFTYLRYHLLYFQQLRGVMSQSSLHFFALIQENTLESIHLITYRVHLLIRKLKGFMNTVLYVIEVLLRRLEIPFYTELFFNL